MEFLTRIRNKRLMRQLRDAIEVDKNAFPFNAECATCGFEWGAHLGMCCPAKSPEERKQELIDALIENKMSIDAFKAAAGVEIPERAKLFAFRGTYFVPVIGKNPDGVVSEL